MNEHYFIRIHTEVGWVYELGFVDGLSAFINPLVPGDYLLYVNCHQEMRPITYEQFTEIYEALIDGLDPNPYIHAVLKSISQ